MKKYILPTALISTLFATFSATAMDYIMDYMAPRTLTELLGIGPDNSRLYHFRSQGRDMARKLTIRSDIFSDNDVNDRGLWAFCNTEELLTFNPSIHDNAQKCNETIPLIMPLELSIGLHHFVDNNISIGENMKNLLALGIAFNHFKLEFIASLLKNYGAETKKIKR